MAPGASRAPSATNGAGCAPDGRCAGIARSASNFRDGHLRRSGPSSVLSLPARVSRLRALWEQDHFEDPYPQQGRAPVSTGVPEIIDEPVGDVVTVESETAAEIAARSPVAAVLAPDQGRQGDARLGAVHRRPGALSRSSRGRSSRSSALRPPNEQSTKFLDEFGSASGPDFSTRTFFGTDGLGRDVFARTLYGARVSLAVAFISTALIVLRRRDDRHDRRLLPRLGRHAALAADGRACSPSRSCCSRSGLGAACSFGEGCVAMDFRRTGIIIVLFGMLGAVVSVCFRAFRKRPGDTAPTTGRELAWGAAAWLVIIIPGLLLATVAKRHGALIKPGLPVVIFVIVLAELALHRRASSAARCCRCARRSSSRRPGRSARPTGGSSSATSCRTSSRRSSSTRR